MRRSALLLMILQYAGAANSCGAVPNCTMSLGEGSAEVGMLCRPARFGAAEAQMAGVRIVLPVARFGCAATGAVLALAHGAASAHGAALLVSRGGCTFDEKARVAAAAGAALLLVSDDTPAQREAGAKAVEHRFKGLPDMRLGKGDVSFAAGSAAAELPTLAIEWAAGEQLRDSARAGATPVVSACFARNWREEMMRVAIQRAATSSKPPAERSAAESVAQLRLAQLMLNEARLSEAEHGFSRAHALTTVQESRTHADAKHKDKIVQLVLAGLRGIAKARGLNTSDPFQNWLFSTVKVFDLVAATFDKEMEGTQNRAPNLILDGIDAVLAEPARGLGRAGASTAAGVTHVLDVGAGTGRMGVLLHSRGMGRAAGGSMTGIDYSRKMIERLRLEKVPGIYSRAELADAVEFLQLWATGNGKPPPHLDLITASDSVIYFPDLMSFFRAANHALGRLGGGCNGTVSRAAGAPPQMLAFTTEATRNSTAVNMWHGRWQHGQHFVEKLAAEAGFRVAYMHQTPLKAEMGRWMLGCAWVLELSREGVCHEANEQPYKYGGDALDMINKL